MSAWSRSPGSSPALWVAAGVAVTLHLAGSWWLQSGRSGAEGAFHRGGHVARPTGDGASIQFTLANARTSAAEPAETSSEVTDGLTLPAQIESNALPEGVALAPPAAGNALLSSRYVGADQLERSPQPQPGWILDESAFPRGRSVRLLVRIWVSEEGVIDQVALVHAEPFGEWATRAIQPLKETPMSAPLMGGRPVPAVIMVEITAEDEGFR